MIDATVSHVGMSEILDNEPCTPPPGSLSKEQGLALLTRLVTDDAFRTLFEQRPISALLEIGVPMALIATLRDTCITPRKLAEEDTLLATRHRLATDMDYSALAFLLPTLKY